MSTLPPGTDPYAVLGVKSDCSEKELKNAYRLQCLKWHPDKNLDNKEEAQRRFIAAREAFEFLFDKAKRAEYDANKEKIRVRDEKQRERMEKADVNRRRFIDELNRREKEAEEQAAKVKLSAAQEAKMRKLQEERIREETRKIREELERQVLDEMRQQSERIRKAHELHRATQRVMQEDEHLAKLKLKWESSEDKGDYTEDALRIIYEPYGSINALSLVPKKKGRRLCIVEFSKRVNAWGAEMEEGMDGGPKIQGEWIVPPAETSADEASKAASGGDVATETAAAEYDDSHLGDMSLDELEAHILGPPAEKKTKTR